MIWCVRSVRYNIICAFDRELIACRIMSISEDVGSLTLPNEPTRSYFGSTRLRSCTPP